MAELAASIIGIVSVGTKVTLVIFEIASDLGSAGEDVQWLGTEISVFCVVLEDLKSTLERAQSSGFSLTSLNNMGVILDHCRAILERIQNVLDKVMKTSASGDAQRMSAMAKAKWTFSKSKIVALRTRLESSKLTLTVMMTGFDWALLLDQKERTEVSQSDADRQSSLFRSLLLSQQFIVQRLENLEGNEPGGETANETEDEGFIPATPGLPGLPGGNLSQTLNETIFHDGMSALERRWSTRSDVSGDQSQTVLNTLCQNFVHSEPARPLANKQPEVAVKPEPHAEPSSFGVTVLFKPLESQYHKYFENEPTREITTTIDIDPPDFKSTVKDKVLAKLGIVYHHSHYCLHHDYGSRDGHISSWGNSDYERCRTQMKCLTGPVLNIQNTLWQTCRDNPPQLQWWKPKLQLLRA